MVVHKESKCPYCIDHLKGIRYRGSCECSGLFWENDKQFKFHYFGGLAVYNDEIFSHIEYVESQHFYAEKTILVNGK